MEICEEAESTWAWQDSVRQERNIARFSTSCQALLCRVILHQTLEDRVAGQPCALGDASTQPPPVHLTNAYEVKGCASPRTCSDILEL
eukprot:355508-Chlamydomonas_euryale.AAC.4